MEASHIQAAGGIVVRFDPDPRFAVVQLRRRRAWVLPKGKLAAGENAVAAARREVLEETGHKVSIHEFVGAISYKAGGKPKVVQFWRMQVRGSTTRKLMDDVKAVDWLPLKDAVAQLSHPREKAFLAEVGPRVLNAARPRLPEAPAETKIEVKKTETKKAETKKAARRRAAARRKRLKPSAAPADRLPKLAPAVLRQADPSPANPAQDSPGSALPRQHDERAAHAAEPVPAAQSAAVAPASPAPPADVPDALGDGEPARARSVNASVALPSLPMPEPCGAQDVPPTMSPLAKTLAWIKRQAPRSAETLLRRASQRRDA